MMFQLFFSKHRVGFMAPSGIYLLVWDPEYGPNSNFLRPTVGGWPHVTLSYMGQKANIPREQMLDVAAKAMRYSSGHVLHVTKAYVNSFQLDDENKTWRHDVLLKLSENDVEFIEYLRRQLIFNFFGAEKSQTFAMRDPHITHATFWNKVEAEERAMYLNTLIVESPQKTKVVKISGVSMNE